MQGNDVSMSSRMTGSLAQSLTTTLWLRKTGRESQGLGLLEPGAGNKEVIGDKKMKDVQQTYLIYY